VGLLELYTSEGCSSCPPAEDWFSQLNTNDRLWRDVVPVAFHVDYWDYLGWRDVFADPLQRTPRDYAEAWNADRSNTGFRVERTDGAVGVITPRFRGFGRRGTLALDLAKSGGTVRFTPANKLAHGTAYVRARNGSVQKINSGENKGRTSRTTSSC
jgi:hypothetical protein